MNLLFILNPIAGKKKTRQSLPIIEDFCKQRDISYKVIETKGPGDATEIARENVSSYDGIVAIGGDGTVLETASGIMGTGTPLGILPLGSGNDLARALNIPLGFNNIDKALSIITKEPARIIDTGRLDGKVFLNIASIGFDAEIIRDLHKVKRYIKGGTAYAVSVFLKFISYQPKPLKITIDGKESNKTLFLAAICNGISYGGGMKVNPKGCMTDGYLDLVLIEPVPRYKIPFLLIKFMKGKYFDLPYVSYHRCKKVFIESKERLAVNIDGESTEAASISFESSPLSLEVFGASEQEDT